ncbi:MAG TPA: hypothetical protein VER98_11735 [Terriglobia bacterium]|nr:hypothetical protein [Terriglobia bacterium]
MHGRKHKAFEKKPVPAYKAAERVIEASSQPTSTKAPDQMPDRMMKAFDEDMPETSQFEQTMKDYYAQTDAEGQGAVPKDPPDNDPMPLQHLEKPRHPPRHNM